MYNTVILVNNTTLHTSKLLSESEVAQSCLTLCDPVDCSSPGSSVHGVLQARKLEWVAISFSTGDLLDPGIEPMSLASPVLAGVLFTTTTTWEAQTFIYKMLFGHMFSFLLGIYLGVELLGHMSILCLTF